MYKKSIKENTDGFYYLKIKNFSTMKDTKKQWRDKPQTVSNA